MSNEHVEGPGPMWDRRYKEHGWSAVPDENLVELVAGLPPRRALDLGCGTGRNALWLARTGWRVTGVDASQVGLDMATEQANREGVTLHTVRADLLDYVPDAQSFDLVVVANIHLAPSQRDTFFERAAAAVAPGGISTSSGTTSTRWASPVHPRSTGSSRSPSSPTVSRDSPPRSSSVARRAPTRATPRTSSCWCGRDAT